MTSLTDLADTGPAIRPRTEILPKPPWAAYIWSDEHNIYIELPCPVGKAPVLVQYALTEGGLAKALALIQQNANIKKSPPPPGYFRHGEAKVVPIRKQPIPLVQQPDLLKNAVKAALKKTGVI